MPTPSLLPLPLPPGYRSWELLVRLGAIQSDTLGFLMAATRRYGDLVSLQAGAQTAILAHHPDAVRRVLHDNHANYTKDTLQYRALATITGQGLLTNDGPAWLRQRRLAQPAFARPRLAGLETAVLPAAGHLLDGWEEAARQGRPVDVDAAMLQITLEVVGRALFSIDLHREAGRLTGATLTVLDHIIHQARHPLSAPGFLPTPRNLRFKRALRALDAAVYELIAARQAQDDPGQDLLGRLLQARDEHSGQAMTLTQVRDEVITLLIAGHETVASALTWSWYLLAQHPAAREELEAELERVLHGRPPGTADLPALEYTALVFHEALRLYPPAWVITRQALAGDEACGYRIPAGALVIISPYVLHRHPRLWPDPERFDPLRFVEDPQCSRPRFSYIPFGSGPRLCIGNHFALVEAQLILAAVAQRFRLELDPGQDVQVDALVTLRPRRGLPMRLVRR
ncbi:MAG: cytochrome P450 [Chloroflexi bacterium]|nr:cytochrome P450 [Chloroflexota bacterium]